LTWCQITWVIGCDSDWWVDVLENGQASTYTAFFDIDWWPVKEELRGKVLLPMLEDHYGAVLEAGLLRLNFDDKKGEFGISYYDNLFPIDPATYSLSDGWRDSARNIRRSIVSFRKMWSCLTALKAMQQVSIFYTAF